MKQLAVLGMLLLPSCAQQFMRAAQSDCTGFGYPYGSPAYAACVQNQFNSRQNQFQTSMGNLSRMNQQNLDHLSPVTPPGGAAFLKGNVVSGTSRICSYDRLGSPYVMTIGATELCPIALP